MNQGDATAMLAGILPTRLHPAVGAALVSECAGSPPALRITVERLLGQANETAAG